MNDIREIFPACPNDPLPHPPTVGGDILNLRELTSFVAGSRFYTAEFEVYTKGGSYPACNTGSDLAPIGGWTLPPFEAESVSLTELGRVRFQIAPTGCAVFLQTLTRRFNWDGADLRHGSEPSHLCDGEKSSALIQRYAKRCFDQAYAWRTAGLCVRSSYEIASAVTALFG